MDSYFLIFSNHKEWGKRGIYRPNPWPLGHRPSITTCFITCFIIIILGWVFFSYGDHLLCFGPGPTAGTTTARQGGDPDNTFWASKLDTHWTHTTAGEEVLHSHGHSWHQDWIYTYRQQNAL